MAITSKKIKTSMNEINAKRIHDIFAYLMGLNSPICNPNCKPIAKANPIMVISAYNELLDIQKEVAELKLDIAGIDIDRVFQRNYANEVEKFVANLQDGISVVYAEQDYKRMIELEGLEAVYPYEERMKRKNQLVLEIERKSTAQSKLAKVAPQLVKNEDQVINQLQCELDSLEETLDIPTREEIRLFLYNDAVRYLEHLKKMIDTKIDYIEALIKEM